MELGTILILLGGIGVGAAVVLRERIAKFLINRSAQKAQTSDEKPKPVADKSWKKIEEKANWFGRLLIYLATAAALGYLIFWYFDTETRVGPVLTWLLAAFLLIILIVTWRYDNEKKKLEWWPGLAIGLGAIVLFALVFNKSAEPIAKVYYSNTALTQHETLKEVRIGPLPAEAKDIMTCTVKVPASGWSPTVGQTCGTSTGELRLDKGGSQAILTRTQLSRKSVIIDPLNPVLSSVNDQVRATAPHGTTTTAKLSKQGLRPEGVLDTKFQSTNGKETTVTIYVYTK